MVMWIFASAFEDLWLYYLLAFAVAGALSFGATPLVKMFAQRVGAIDVPKDDRRMHTAPVVAQRRQ